MNNPPITILFDCGHRLERPDGISIVTRHGVITLEEIPQDKLPFDKEEALRTGKAVVHGLCPACAPPQKIIRKTQSNLLQNGNEDAAVVCSRVFILRVARWKYP